MALLSALGHLANLGQFVEIGQGHHHQREQIRWTSRNYKLDVEALKIDLLGAARDDVRGTYDTYIERLDTLLLLNVLLLPFAFNTLQFSDEFMPRTEEQCEYCTEAEQPWLVIVWTYLVGVCLIMPFWSLLLLLWCKMRMEKWLQKTLFELQRMRRDFMVYAPPAEAPPSRTKSGLTPETRETTEVTHENIVRVLGGFIVEYQDQFTDLWTNDCAPLLLHATRLLWSSACVSVLLVGLMFWLFLSNRQGRQNSAHYHFAVLITLGLLAPVVMGVYIRYKRCSVQAPPEPEEPFLEARRRTLSIPSLERYESSALSAPPATLPLVAVQEQQLQQPVASRVSSRRLTSPASFHDSPGASSEANSRG